MQTATRINEDLVLYIKDVAEEIAIELDATEANEKAFEFALSMRGRHGLTVDETIDLYQTLMDGGC